MMCATASCSGHFPDRRTRTAGDSIVCGKQDFGLVLIGGFKGVRVVLS